MKEVKKPHKNSLIFMKGYLMIAVAFWITPAHMNSVSRNKITTI